MLARGGAPENLAVFACKSTGNLYKLRVILLKIFQIFSAIYLADSGKFQIHMMNSLVSLHGLKFAGWTVGSRKQRRVGTAAGVHASEVSLAGFHRRGLEILVAHKSHRGSHLSLPYSQGNQ